MFNSVKFFWTPQTTLNKRLRLCTLIYTDAF